MRNERTLTLRAGFSGSAKRSRDTIHWAITLINGETLIDLLIQHEIGVKKKTVDY
jgi:restriction endonuclease Mrr